jgi:TonB family protein
MQLVSQQSAPRTRCSLQTLQNRSDVLVGGGIKLAAKDSGVDYLLEAGRLTVNRTWPAMLLLFCSVTAYAVATPAVHLSRMEPHERQFWRNVVRSFQVVDVGHISARRSCGDVHPPEALATPDPLFNTSSAGRRVKVSFIIGVDGRVHSPLILESAGLAGDRRVLQTVRTWRYRPATCNGVPTETEGKVEFSNR